HAKVYGKEPKGTPPMTVPHLDRRHIDNKDILLFGPFAGLGPKFLKQGSNTDLVKSIKPNNIVTLLEAGIVNIPLGEGAVQQLRMTEGQRMEQLRRFGPDAKAKDWELVTAGKRIQVIKDTKGYGKGFIQCGTEVVHSKDNTLAALLGESPGASISVSIMLNLLEETFPDYMPIWEQQIKEMIPSYGKSLTDQPNKLHDIHASSSQSLLLNKTE